MNQVGRRSSGHGPRHQVWDTEFIGHEVIVLLELQAWDWREHEFHFRCCCWKSHWQSYLERNRNFLWNVGWRGGDIGVAYKLLAWTKKKEKGTISSKSDYWESLKWARWTSVFSVAFKTSVFHQKVIKHLCYIRPRFFSYIAEVSPSGIQRKVTCFLGGIWRFALWFHNKLSNPL